MNYSVNIWHSGFLFDPYERVICSQRLLDPQVENADLGGTLLFGLLLVPDLGQCCFFTLEESGHSQDLSTWS